jgi:hypothetical protein
MTEIQQTNPLAQTDRPGKTRTEWHPLLVAMLRFALDPAFRVEAEVSLGKPPLRVDILLVRREGGKIPEAALQDLAALARLLNRFTLVELKGPTDVMQRGDFAHLVACSYLWHTKEPELVPHEEVSLVVILPAVNGPLRDEIQALGFQVSPHEHGVFRVDGLPFAAWLVETDVMAEQGEPILSLVSRAFLHDRRSIIDKLARKGHRALAHYHYMVQQVQQFRDEEDFAMQQALLETLEQFDEELVTRMLEELPTERRLRGLPPEERLRGLPLEERLAGLSDEDVARLRELLDRKKRP